MKDSSESNVPSAFTGIRASSRGLSPVIPGNHTCRFEPGNKPPPVTFVDCPVGMETSERDPEEEADGARASGVVIVMPSWNAPASTDSPPSPKGLFVTVAG